MFAALPPWGNKMHKLLRAKAATKKLENCGNSKLSGTQKEYIRLKDGSKDKWSSLKVELKTSVRICLKKGAIKTYNCMRCDKG